MPLGAGRWLAFERKRDMRTGEKDGASGLWERRPGARLSESLSHGGGITLASFGTKGSKEHQRVNVIRGPGAELRENSETQAGAKMACAEGEAGSLLRQPRPLGPAPGHWPWPAPRGPLGQAEGLPSGSPPVQRDF